MPKNVLCRRPAKSGEGRSLGILEPVVWGSLSWGFRDALVSLGRSKDGFEGSQDDSGSVSRASFLGSLWLEISWEDAGGCLGGSMVQLLKSCWIIGRSVKVQGGSR